jgi:hypothetical protein
MKQKTWMPEGVLPDKPNPARMYDYALGGYHNFEVDRIAFEESLKVFPDGRLVVQANRAFLRRAINFMLDQGIDQFLDIGSGIPTVGNVHEVVQARNPKAPVVYVDIDPIAVFHSKALLKDNALATALQADARDTEAILNHPEVKRLLDLERPLGVLLVAVLNFVLDNDEARGVVSRLRDAVTPGSYIAIGHAFSEPLPQEVVDRLEEIYAGSDNPGGFRTRKQIERLFEGLEVVEPGIVLTPLWRPEGPDDIFLDEPERTVALAGIGRVPERKG